MASSFLFFSFLFFSFLFFLFFSFLFFQNSPKKKELAAVQTERLTELAKSVDPSRLVSGASGWHDKPVGDIIDMHIYLGPGHTSSALSDSDTHDVVLVSTATCYSQTYVWG